MVACSPFGPAGEFAASRHGALTRSQAANHGLTDKVVRRLVRDGVVTEPVPGVLVVTGSPPTWHQRLYVATLASKGAGAAGARAAGALHCADGYGAGPLELLVPGNRHIALPDVVVRRGPFHEDDLCEVDGIHCTTIARTLVDLGSIDPLPKVKAAFEWAWRNGVSLTWIERTAERLLARRRPGPRMILGLVDQARRQGRPTESALESKVEDTIATLPGLVRQFDVRRADGTLVARVDFAIPHLKLAIEAHSRRHHFGFDAPTADAAREADLMSEGWSVRYVTDAERRAPDRLRASLLAMIDGRLRLLAG
jgi:very-short-patch-repair endonuclease